VLRIGVVMAAVLAAFQVQIGQLQVPAPIGFVNDFANVIPAESEARITRIAEDVRAKSGGEIAVVTLRDIGDEAPSDVALRIGREWGVGRGGAVGTTARNAGVVILLVPKETSGDGRGHSYITTGFGTEGFITDAIAGRIQDAALPDLRAGPYGPALETMALLVADRFAGEFGFALDTALGAPRELRRVLGLRGEEDR